MDVNFGLGDLNPVNPWKTYKSGKKLISFGNLFYISLYVIVIIIIPIIFLLLLSYFLILLIFYNININVVILY